MVASHGSITELAYECVDDQLVVRTRKLLFVVVVLTLVSVGVARGQTAGSGFQHDPFEPGTPLLTYASTPEIAKPPAAVFNVVAGIQAAARSANNESGSPHGNHLTHIKVGAVTGAAVGGIAGGLVGIITDQHDSNAQVHYSGSGVVLGVAGIVIGALVGGFVDALMPHS